MSTRWLSCDRRRARRCSVAITSGSSSGASSAKFSSSHMRDIVFHSDRKRAFMHSPGGASRTLLRVLRLRLVVSTRVRVTKLAFSVLDSNFSVTTTAAVHDLPCTVDRLLLSPEHAGGSFSVLLLYCPSIFVLDDVAVAIISLAHGLSLRFVLALVRFFTDCRLRVLNRFSPRGRAVGRSSGGGSFFDFPCPLRVLGVVFLTQPSSP